MTGAPSSMPSPQDWHAHSHSELSVQAAREIILRSICPVHEVETVPLREGLERILAQDVRSPLNVPSHDNAAMDGWALRHGDLSLDQETELQEQGLALAGRPFVGRLEAGQAVRIMTGAVLPSGSDTVVPQELVERFERKGARWIRVPSGQLRGQHRRQQGEDLRAGHIALKAGRRLSAADLGLLASLGLSDISVRRRVRVALLSTGNELRTGGEPLDPGSIYDSNRLTLWGLLHRLGVETIDLGIVRDARAALEDALGRACAQADVIISTGGVSVGEADFTREVMSRLGEVAFWSIAMRPGRPMAFGQLHSAWFFGLPGNPVAAMVTFLVLVRDALLQLSGAEPQVGLPVQARCVQAIRKRPGRTEYLRAIVSLGADGQWEARLTGPQGSGVLRSMSDANALIVLNPETETVAPGQWVSALPFQGLLD